MRCPRCRKKDTKVIDSRTTGDNEEIIRRRRVCEKCDFRFSTSEQIEILNTKVLKEGGDLEIYDRKKMSAGLMKALKKGDMTEERINSLIISIEYEISKKIKEGQIASKDIGEIILRKLKRIDKLAYLRFASVYRAFSDLREFEKEIRSIKQAKRGLKSVRKKV